MSLSTNNLLKGRYRIESVLGQGGMGAVYQATDELLNIPVAVKENMFLSEEYTRQFKQETRILASLRHPNLPRVLDFCNIEGQGQYLIMDYIGGEDLRDLLKRSGQLSEKDVVLIGFHICEALHYMHTQIPMVVHRDVKPGNIKLTEKNEIYLVDFGLAKQVSTRSQMTMTGARAMTPGFSPPEQYGTARTDERSDIYSLGATLYNALTGVVPEDALDRVTDKSELTPILNHRKDTEQRLVRVIEKSMALNPDDRYQTAKEFQEALLFAARMQSVSMDVKRLYHFDLNEVPDEDVKKKSFRVIPPKKSKSGSFTASKKKSWIGWAFLLLLFLAAAGLASMRPDWIEKTWKNTVGGLLFGTETMAVELPSTATQEPFPTGTPEFTETIPVLTMTLTLTAILEPTITLTPTSTPSATAESAAQAVNVQETTVPSATMNPIITPAEVKIQDQYPIVFASNRMGTIQLWLMDEDGKEKIQLTNMQGGACQPAWSPDGTQIAFVSPCQHFQDEHPDAILYVYTFTDKSIVPLLEIENADEKVGNSDPAWSPDGSKVVYTSGRTGTSHINVYNLDTTQISELSNSQYDDYHPSWHPEGDSIVFVRNQVNAAIWEISLDGNDLRKISQSGNVNNYHPVWDAEGKFILFSQHEASQVPWLVKLFRANFASSLEENIFIEDVSASFPVSSPVFTITNSEIIFESWPDGNNHDIYRVNIDGTGLTRLTTNSGYDFDPDFYHHRIQVEQQGEE